MSQSNEKSNSEKRKSKVYNFILLLFCLLITAVFGALINRYIGSYNDLRTSANNIYAELQRERAIYQDLQYQLAHFDSDAYIEHLAREHLGWVMPNELVLRKMTD